MYLSIYSISRILVASVNVKDAGSDSSAASVSMS